MFKSTPEKQGRGWVAKVRRYYGGLSLIYHVTRPQRSRERATALGEQVVAALEVACD